EPKYAGPVIYVKDASRSVGIAQALINQSSRGELVAKVRAENAKRRERHASKSRLKPQITLAQARRNRAPIAWPDYNPPTPNFLGTKAFDIDLQTLVNYIDWMPFFNAWEFHGKYPAILTDAVVGEEASKLKHDADALLQQVIEEKWLKANAVIGLYPAHSDGDDVLVFADESRDELLHRFHFLRQQRHKPAGQPHYCLADFVAPHDSGRGDYLGGFVVSAGHGIDQHVARFERDHDDYNSIMLKALADRLAEAAAEYVHERVRRDHWGYASDEQLTNDDLIAESYGGIRPAPGYPACPDHTEKDTLWALLDARNRVGVSLTESYAMLPTAAVSGLYFAHPEARYFSVGGVDRDQIESYAERKGLPVAEVERWLAPNLGYVRDAADAA
ncbi:MAG: vitamin B12 dependent-methionine synthase activation domain-containing protein, partial [Pseudomonadota bacterium]